MRRLFLPLAVALLAAGACTPAAYVKPGMTEAERDRDLGDCIEIARRQAFRDAPFAGVGLRTGRRYAYPGRYGAPFYYDRYPTRADLELRYQRVCMNARGYSLEPVDRDG